ncbi:ubiquinone biosynthesis accessory factor UbiJ [Testudinibacter sp. P80/BLE/0925]|uniref:ubiquinone biosynthesis accessory factor UbiJ n=1 Tax=Testudinibacter sp. TW-1 TaxID=3417757 RepID=UPI003D362125
MLPNWEQLKTQLMLPQWASSALETALLHLLKRTENGQPHLRKLNGKILAIQLRQPEMNCYFVFSAQQIDVLHQYEGEADCTVQTSAKTLLKMPKKSELTRYINDKSIVLHGDLQVLQDFLGLLDVVEKDPAELLAPYVGDVLAYNMTQLAKQGLAFFQRKQQNANRHWGERLSEEWRLTAPMLAVADFQQQVSDLSRQSDRLEQKFQQLLDKLGMEK